MRNYTSHIKIQVLSLLYSLLVAMLNTIQTGTLFLLWKSIWKLYFIWKILADGYTHLHWIILSPLWDVTVGRSLQIEVISSKVCMYLASSNGLKYLWGFFICKWHGKINPAMFLPLMGMVSYHAVVPSLMLPHMWWAIQQIPQQFCNFSPANVI